MGSLLSPVHQRGVGRPFRSGRDTAAGNASHAAWLLLRLVLALGVLQLVLALGMLQLVLGQTQTLEGVRLEGVRLEAQTNPVANAAQPCAAAPPARNGRL